jgi:hypothetical protein
MPDQNEPQKDQAAAAELETKSEELKPEDVEKVAGGGVKPDPHGT